MGKRSYGIYNKFDVVYADFGRNPHGVEGGVRPGVIISFGFNGKVQILAPESVKEQYKQMIAQADEGMQEKGNKEQEM